jgi:anaerobic magnesium-protoporphyrin IX monomethyl ester cyclase
MNILFICPLNESFSDIVGIDKVRAWEVKKNQNKKYKQLQLVHPNGLLSIAAYTSKYKKSANIKILDFNIMIGTYLDKSGSTVNGISRESFWGYCLSETDDFVPDLIGISASFCSNFNDLNPLADFLGTRYVKCLITCGSHLPSACYKDIFAHGEKIDAICFGEGEKPFLELVDAMGKGIEETYLENNGCWITKNKIYHSENFKPSNNLIHDLDEIPPYDLKLIVKKDGYANYTPNLFSIVDSVGKEQLTLLTTRGCPCKCVFCASQHVHGHKVRSYSVERIKQDILHYRNDGVDEFVFYDDHFLSNKKRAADILEFMIDNKIPSKVANVAFFSIDEKIAKLLRKAGNTNLFITIENANEETLKNIMHKPANLEVAKKAIKYLKNEGIIIYSNILVGLPGETKESIEKGAKELLNVGCNWYNCYVTAPLPGSELFEICKENNYLVKDVDVYRMDFKKCVIRTPDFEPDYIEKKTYEINLYVNFVENYDMRTGNYEIALMMFEKVINLVIDTHAFAYYFAAVCANALGLSEKYAEYKNKYNEMIQRFDFWREWAERFELKPLPPPPPPP